MTTATNGQEALDELEKMKPDLILTDVMMPIVDGIELTRRVRKMTSMRAVPIIMLSARAGKFVAHSSLLVVVTFVRRD